MYVKYEFYKQLYGSDAVKEIDFNRYSWEVDRKLDYYTSGVDGVKKLKIAFPTDDEGSECVKRCACALIDLVNKINQAERNAREASGYIQREDGNYQGKIVSSVSAGNESISFSTGSNKATIFDKALTDRAIKEQLFIDIIREYLSNVTDANGVNLLYMGPYPYVIRG